MKRSMLALAALAAGLSFPFAGRAAVCEAIDLTSPPGWIWKAHEGDGHFETYIYAFRENGELRLEERLPGGKTRKETAAWRLAGRTLKVKFQSRFFKGEEVDMPCNFFNGQLQLTMNGETYVFDPKLEE